METELKQLVNTLLEKGTISDKEREILLRKVEKMGLDKDVFELELENMIAVSKKQHQDGFEISNEELLIRCKKWIQLALLKTYKGEIESFPDVKEDFNIKNQALKVGKVMLSVLENANPIGNGMKLLKSTLRKSELKNEEIIQIAEKYLLLLEFRRNENHLMEEKYLEYRELLKINIETYKASGNMLSKMFK
jgi:hypothetical protein